MFKSLNKLLNEASCYSCTEGVDKIFSWLKFFKERYCPQKQWKPTEEQMNALGFVIECSKLPSGSFKYKSVLRGLKAQLSALCSDLE